MKRFNQPHRVKARRERALARRIQDNKTKPCPAEIAKLEERIKAVS